MLLTAESLPEPDSVIKAPRIQGLHRALLVSAGIFHKQNKEPREAGIHLVYMGKAWVLFCLHHHKNQTRKRLKAYVGKHSLMARLPGSGGSD